MKLGICAIACLLAACGGMPLAPKAPVYEPEGETKCAVQRDQDHPLIIEWPGNDRVALESRLSEGVVPVHYQGCEMQVLTTCSSTVAYSYKGVTRETENVAISDADMLYANLPLGAAKFEADLERSGGLDVNMTIAGRYSADSTTVGLSDLEGAGCQEATHVIVAVNVGAFELSSRAGLKVGADVDIVGRGGGARHEGNSRRLKSGGDPEACDAASRSDTEPPEGCSALLRVEVVPIGEAARPVPVCPEGSEWTGAQCERTHVVTRLTCPAGTRLRGEICEPLVSRECPSGTRYHEGRGCVAIGGVKPERPKPTPTGLSLAADGGTSSNYKWVWGVVGGVLAAGVVTGLVVKGQLENDGASSSDSDGSTPATAPGREGDLDNVPLSSSPLRWSF